jgi:hypothetical protein
MQGFEPHWNIAKSPVKPGFKSLTEGLTAVY